MILNNLIREGPAVNVDDVIDRCRRRSFSRRKVLYDGWRTLPPVNYLCSLKLQKARKEKSPLPEKNNAFGIKKVHCVSMTWKQKDGHKECL